MFNKNALLHVMQAEELAHKRQLGKLQLFIHDPMSDT